MGTTKVTQVLAEFGFPEQVIDECRRLWEIRCIEPSGYSESQVATLATLFGASRAEALRTEAAGLDGAFATHQRKAEWLLLCLGFSQQEWDRRLKTHREEFPA